MHIGQTIRKYRKMKNLTQEEMANRLGITASAVNKWENENSLPDIALLAPIARLLDISLDTLLSFEKELTREELRELSYELERKLNENLEEAFPWAKKRLEQHPNCYPLFLQTGALLDGWCMMNDVEEPEKYAPFIQECYERALESGEEEVRIQAAELLFVYYERKEQYEKAEEYLSYFSSQNPERKRNQARIYSKTGRREEAYKAYEELLFSEYQMVNGLFLSLYRMALQDQNMEKARALAEKQSQLARIFEMGKYNEVSLKLDLAAAEKDAEMTLETMAEMLASADSIYDFTQSSLYEHMTFQEREKGVPFDLKDELIKCFQDEETFGYLKGDERWKELVER